MAQSAWENVCVGARRRARSPNYPPLLTAARQDARCERLDEEFYCCSLSFQEPRCNHGLFIPPFSEVDVLEQTCLRGVRSATRCVKKFPPTLGIPWLFLSGPLRFSTKIAVFAHYPGYLARAAIGSGKLQWRRPVLPAGQQSTGRFILRAFSWAG